MGLVSSQHAAMEKIGVKFIQVLPAIQLQNEKRKQNDGVICVGDIGTEIRTWFGRTNDSMVILRPDRFVAALAIPQSADQISQALFAKLHSKAEANQLIA